MHSNTAIVGDSLKLKSDKRIEIQKMQKVSRNLEIENNAMERRIAKLKSTMKDERAFREKLGGTRWQSSLSHKSPQQLQFIGTKKVSNVYKKLQDKPLTHYARKVLEKTNVPSRPDWTGSDRKSESVLSSNEPKKISINSKIDSSYAKTGNSLPHSLLDGSYNEEESAASFQEALMNWRRSKLANEHQQVVQTTSISVETSAGNVVPPSSEVKIAFASTSTLSYFDRIFLKHARLKSHLSNISQKSPSSESTINPAELRAAAPDVSCRDTDSDVKIEHLSPFISSLDVNNELDRHEYMSCNDLQESCDLLIEPYQGEDTFSTSILPMVIEHPDEIGKPSNGMVRPVTDDQMKQDLLNENANHDVSSVEDQAKSGTFRIWSPKPNYHGMDGILCAGVEDPDSSFSNFSLPKVGQESLNEPFANSRDRNDVSRFVYSNELWVPSLSRD